MYRNVLWVAVCALACAAAFGTRAATMPAKALPLALAQQVVDQTIGLVESKGVYPRQKEEYAQAKEALLAVVDGKTAEVDEAGLHARIRALLATLDADGHSMLLPAVPPGQPAMPMPARPPAPQFQVVATQRGTVLRWVPPATTYSTPEARSAYVNAVVDEAAALPGAGQACALVVDLSAQTGGNAWPPFIAMYPLFGEANQARWVDRDGKEVPVVNRANLEQMAGNAAPGRASPFARFATGPLAVLVGDRTASAGEMLLVALMGEARVRTFGKTSYGMSTANAMHRLPNGATLVLTEMRYALGDGPVIHGGIPVTQPAAAGATWEASVREAAEWAAANSPRCVSE
jgi:hypothetical protein